MKSLTLFILFLAGINTHVFGQIKSIDLQGEWFTNNDDSLYFKSDTIELFSGTNYFQKFTTCRVIKWIINKHDFNLENVNTCSEPGIVTQYIDKESLELTRNASKQFIEYFRGGKKIDSFEVLSYHEEKIFQYPYDVKTLKLKRFK
jgi:hypothetical protein